MFLIALTLISVAVLAEETKPTQEQEIKTLIEQLGTDDLETRNVTQKNLIEIGEGLIEAYKKTKDKTKIQQFADTIYQSCRHKDTEIKHRANQIRQYCYYLTQPKIVFAAKREGKHGIYIMHMDGGNLKRLTDSKSINYMPTCSPDGKRIAFLAKGGFYVMDIGGGNKKLLIESKNLGGISDLAWSPDGTKIAFIAAPQGDIWQLYVIDTDRKNLKQLTKHTGKVAINTFSWSPDETKIAFSHFFYKIADFTQSIYVIDSDGKNLKKLTKTKAYNDKPMWSPDSKRIVFWSNPAGNPDIYVINSDGSNLKRLTNNKNENSLPSWSPDGTKIAFAVIQDSIKQLYVMDADGKNQKNLTKNQLNAWLFMNLTWSPDSKRIIFIHITLTSDSIYIIDADGKNLKQLTNNPKDKYLSPPVLCPSSISDISEMFKEN